MPSATASRAWAYGAVAAVDQLEPGGQDPLGAGGVAALQQPLREVVRGGRAVLGVAGGDRRLPVLARRVELAGVVGDPGERQVRGRQVGVVAEVDHHPPGGRRPLLLPGPLVGEGEVVGGARPVLGVAGGDRGPVRLAGPLHVAEVVEDDGETQRGLRAAGGLAEGEDPLEQPRRPLGLAVLGEVPCLLAQPRRVVGRALR